MAYATKSRSTSAGTTATYVAPSTAAAPMARCLSVNDSAARRRAHQSPVAAPSSPVQMSSRNGVGQRYPNEGCYESKRSHRNHPWPEHRTGA
jgi:hypothetical protein